MSLFNWLRRIRQQPDSSSRNVPRVTWASETISRSMQRARELLRRQLWIWPIIAVVLLSIVGFSVRAAIESTMKGNLRSELETLLNVETEMLKTWFEDQASNAETMANDLHVREAVAALLERPSGEADADAVADPQQLRRKLEKELAPAMSSHSYHGYFLVDKKKRIVDSTFPELLQRDGVAAYDDFLERTLDGDPIVTAPFPSVVAMRSHDGSVKSGVPTMYACAPIRDTTFQVIGAIALQIRPGDEFTRILQLARMGESGETYAFDKHATMVSNSRFDNDLILLGLLPDNPDAVSILGIQVHDPLGDMTAGYRPNRRRSEMPMTRMAEAAVQNVPGVDVEGYRDYRGVMVVGAWKWLPEYGIGVATEVDVAEAFLPLTILRRTFMVMYVLLIIAAIAIFVFTLILARMRREAQRAAMKAEKLGQYTLEERLGSGAMGIVYKGHHSMLRRPTAIKMLNADQMTPHSISRFEREVQITCKLNHPNTIAIYDYGRTPEDVFYYAMEYLDGIDLQELVDTYGPQSEARAIHILRQVCGSLYEAHSEGLVHRDIKPANVMLNRRGAEPDIVKVLDFGLVKGVNDEKGRTKAGNLTGTPLYMSPESIETPLSIDVRSDLYAVGALGYFLVTGETVFDAETLNALCRKHIEEMPVPPTKRGAKVSSEYEAAILACLEKSRAKRPQTARDLLALLEKSEAANLWTIEWSDAWWGRHERGQTGIASIDEKAAQTIADAGKTRIDVARTRVDTGRTQADGGDATLEATMDLE